VTIRRFFAAVALLVASAAPAAAGEPTDRLRTFFNRANQVLLAPESEGGGLEERLTAVRGLVNEVIDFEGAAALALGRHWDSLSPPAQKSFTLLYADVVERAYLSWVGSKARVGQGGVSIRWVAESIDGDAAVVTTELLTRIGGEMPIEYRMVQRAAGWLVRANAYTQTALTELMRLRSVDLATAGAEMKLDAQRQARLRGNVTNTLKRN